MFKKKLIVLSSPSGGGKSTLANHLMTLYPEIRFSVSCTTRKIREGEVHGKDYFFLSKEEFEEKIANGEFAEYEQIFGNYYGTLKSEIKKHINSGNSILFDVDVKGAVSLRRNFPEDTLLIFIYPPSLDELQRRLEKRRTESEEELNTRLERAKEELTYKDKFDYAILNDDLKIAFDDLEKVIKSNLS
ncbi:MAG: guanylate kinase [Ignavibacteriae bacterium]|nr:guanylate kinase [Ignavibacteriota bacterium]